MKFDHVIETARSLEKYYYLKMFIKSEIKNFEIEKCFLIKISFLKNIKF